MKNKILSWEEFCNRFTQIYGDPKATITAKRKLQELIQRGLAIDYII